MAVWLVDIAALNASDEATVLRFGSDGYTEVDGGQYYYYEPRLVQPAIFNLVAYTGNLLPGISGESSAGNIELQNIDGELNWLADYAVDGRSMTLRHVDGGVAAVVLAATVESMHFNNERVVLVLRNPLAGLEQALPGNRFAGNNLLPDGVEGTTDDIGGTRKPKAFGQISNASPVLVNSSKLVYQVHDGADVTVTEVRDRGVVLTFESEATDLNDLLNSPPLAGQWRRYQGYFALGSGAQAVTCDAQRTSVAAGDVFAEVAGLFGYTVPAGDIASLNAVGNVGVFIVDDVTGRDLLASLAEGCGAAWWLAPDGQLRVKSLAAPLASADAVVEDWQIASLTRSALGAGRNGLPLRAVNIRADRVETTQTDLATVAPNQGRYASEYREATASSAAVEARHPLSTELSISSALRDMAAASALATALLSLLSVRRDTAECVVELSDPDLASLELGATVELNTPRLGYPRHFVLLGRRPDAKRNRLTLILWG